MATRTYPLAAGAIAVALILSACSAAPDTATSGEGELTLVQSKSPVQLIRNDATNRVDKELVSDIRKTTDASTPCYNEEDNPGGLIRQWKSSAELVLVGGADRDAATKSLVDSVIDQGWTAEEVSEDDSFGLTLLTSSSSVASIEISSADFSAVAIIRITATGPCVVTDGPDSDEVTSLE
jgi:hypothetical protein